jgi:3-hydroxyacyl-CoA dehydrogenase/enoyl-CoA hydratase/carnithine racemase
MLEKFAPLFVDDTEVITHSLVQEVPLKSGKTLALITLDNHKDHTRPTTLGPLSLKELDEALDALEEQAKKGEIHGIAITGKPYFLAAGADLSKIGAVKEKIIGRLYVELGHYVFAKLGDSSVPTFVFINGLALGGGVEIALNAKYRTLNSAAPALGLPEVFLGIIPGWGGSYLLPNLIGIKNALKVIVENPLKQNRMLKPAEAYEMGIADVMFEPQRFLEQSIDWADEVINGKKVKRPNEPGTLERKTVWPAAVKMARSMIKDRLGEIPESPYVALDLIEAARSGTRDEGFKREDDVMEELVSGDKFRASMYSFNLVQKHAKNPQGAPDKSLARPVTKVGVIGAGLMASQLALLFLRRLEVPVVMTDVSQERIDKGLAYVRSELDKMVERGRLDPDDRNRYSANLSGSLDYSAFGNCDWVIEAVFEEMSVKQEVFGKLEEFISEECILASNTSSLSVTEMAKNLKHPERVVGFHFFNPVAVMPLLEVARTDKTNDETMATAMAVGKNLKKTTVIVKDEAAFVVNRLFGVLLSEQMKALDEGFSFDDISEAIKPLGLPMDPFDLLELVGMHVAAHMMDSMKAFDDSRFYASDTLGKLAEHGKILVKDDKGKIKGFDKGAVALLPSATPTRDKETIMTQTLEGLAREIKIMLDDGVVHSVEDIDLAMITGAGWPFHLGGITPFLDREGVSQRVNGQPFHDPMVVGVKN